MGATIPANDLDAVKLAPGATGALPDQYFAILEGEDLVNALVNKVREYRYGVRRMPVYERWVRTYRSYFGLADADDWSDQTAPRASGQAGEQTLARLNHLGNLGRHMLSMTTATRPAFEPVAANTDSKSIAQVEFARTLLDYYMEHERLAAKLAQAAELGLIFGMGHIMIRWDENAGEIVQQGSVDPMTGAQLPPIRSGALVFSVHTPLEVALDHRRRDQVRDWAIVTTYENRWDLMALAPDDSTRELIRAAPGFNPNDAWFKPFYPTTDTSANPDIIAVYNFWHEKTPAVPAGRWARFIPGALLGAGPLAQPEVPVYTLVPGNFYGTQFGDSPLHAVVGLQALLDNLYSAVATNNINLAVQMIEVDERARYNIKTAFNGMRIMETRRLADGTSTGPKPVQLTESSPETYKLIELTVRSMETLTGVNSVVRGDPEASLRTGKALALIKAQAVEFASWFTFSYETTLADVGTAIVRHLKAFAKQPQLAVIAGKGKLWAAQQFDSSGLDNVDRVLVHSGNPVSKQLAFKAQAAEALLEKGLIRTPGEYFAIVETGAIDTASEDEVASYAALKAENEVLLAGPDQPQDVPQPATGPDGKPLPAPSLVPVLWTDNVLEHIGYHKKLLASPQARRDPALVQRVLGHIQEHVNVNLATDPMRLQVLGLPSLRLMMAPPGGAASPGGPSPAPGAPSGGPSSPDQEADSPDGPPPGDQ